MEKSDDKVFKTSVEAAIAYLIGQGVIKKDADVVERMNISKGTLSLYKNGKQPASSNFIKQFESEFKIRLADFEPGAAAANGQKEAPAAEKPSLEEKYVALLEKQVNDQEALKQVVSLVNEQQQTLIALFARVAAGQEVTFECLSMLVNQPAKDLQTRLLGRMNEQLREISTGGIHADIGS